MRGGPYQECGKWYAMHDGEICGPFDTNAQAWRRYDKQAMEPHNRKESSHQWAAEQHLKII